MYVDLFLRILPLALCGAGLGVLAGCVPGIHVNMVSVMILAISAGSRMDPVLFSVVILSMAVVQTFLNILPAIFLGAPDPDAVLSVLPGHRMLLEGRGFEAVWLSVIGSLGAVVLACALALPMIALLPALYPIVACVLFPLLLCIEASVVAAEPTGWKMVYAVLVILLSGTLGILITSSGFMATDKALFPALSGLFGVSTLILSSESGVQIPRQDMDTSTALGRLALAKSTFAGFFAGMIVGILPAVGCAQATVLAQRITGENDHRSFIVAASGVNTANMIFGLVCLYSIGKARNGAVKAIQQLLGGRLDFNLLILLIGVTLMCGGIGALLTRSLGGLFANNISRLPYVLLARGVVAMVAAMVLIICGPRGLLVLFTATFLGFLPPILGIRRVHNMGVLMVPTLIYFSGYRSFILGLL